MSHIETGQILLQDALMAGAPLKRVQCKAIALQDIRRRSMGFKGGQHVSIAGYRTLPQDKHTPR